MPVVGDIVYRARVNYCLSGVDYTPFTVMRVTPAGFWVRAGDQRTVMAVMEAEPSFLDPRLYRDRWCPNSTRYVSMTKEEALERLKCRMAAWVKHAQRRLNTAENHYRAVFGQAPGRSPLQDIRLLRGIYRYEDWG